MSDLSFWTSCILDGVANGFIYGLLALSLVLMYRTNKLFNFSQTTVVSFLMIMAVFFVGKIPFYAVFILALASGFGINVLLHFGVMRQITERRTANHWAEVLAVFGLLAAFDGLSNFVFGDTPVAFPSMFPEGDIAVAGFNLSFNSIGIIGTSLGAVLIIGAFFRFTSSGLLMEAVAENITASRLRGIRASNVLALAWGVTGLIGLFAGLLIAPTSFVSPVMLAPVFGYSLISVVIGGLESPGGAILGGTIVGVVENIAGNIEFLGSELKFSVVFLVLIIVLTIRPRGLFGKIDMRRV